MKLINLFILCLVFNVTNLSEKDDPVLNSFKKTINVKCEISPIKSDDLGEIVDFVLFDSIVVVNEMFQPYIFKYFNRNTGKKYGDFIRKGNGPNELNNPGGLFQYNDSIFNIYDVNKKKLIYLNTRKIIKKDYSFYKVVDFENPGLVFFKVYPVSESMFLCTGLFENGAYCIYESKTKAYKTSVDFPVEEKHKSDNNQQKSMANQGRVALSPDKSKFVFASGRGYIDFCKIKNMDIELTKRNFYFSPEYKVINNVNIGFSRKDSKYGFMDVLATEKYIYALYSGRTMNEAGTGTFEANNILVYDWDGNPIVNYKTDCFIRSIKYDEKKIGFLQLQRKPGYCSSRNFNLYIARSTII